MPKTCQHSEAAELLRSTVVFHPNYTVHLCVMVQPFFVQLGILLSAHFLADVLPRHTKSGHRSSKAAHVVIGPVLPSSYSFQNGLYSSLPYLCFVFFACAGGPIADFIVGRKLVSVGVMRKIMDGIGIFGLIF